MDGLDSRGPAERTFIYGLGAVVIAGLIAFAWVWLDGSSTPKPEPAPVAATTAPVAPPAPVAQAQERTSVPAVPVFLEPDDKADPGNVKTADAAKVRDLVQSGKAKMTKFSLSESGAGGRVSLTSAGVTVEVDVSGAPAEVSMPYEPGVPIKLVVLSDKSGDGLSIGMHAGQTLVGFQKTAVGQSLQIGTPSK